MALDSNELNARITQLLSGLITECEFVASVQVDERTQAQLNAFNKLDPVIQNWDFTFDDFNNWESEN
jgi:hypothetical protein